MSNQPNGQSLYIAWKLKTADVDSAGAVKMRLVQGQGRNLYRLRSWVVANGEVRALLAPEAPLEKIAEAVWPEGSLPLRSRWVAGRRACAAAAREIETVPVSLGLATRPEQWPWSSAAME